MPILNNMSPFIGISGSNESLFTIIKEETPSSDYSQVITFENGANGLYIKLVNGSRHIFDASADYSLINGYIGSLRYGNNSEIQLYYENNGVYLKDDYEYNINRYVLEIKQIKF